MTKKQTNNNPFSYILPWGFKEIILDNSLHGVCDKNVIKKKKKKECDRTCSLNSSLPLKKKAEASLWWQRSV